MNNNNEFTNFSKWLSSLSANEFTLSAMFIGFIITQNLNYQEQNTIGNWFECVGQIILTLSAQNQLLTPSDPSIIEKINNLQNQIDKLKEEL
mgnify:CR=1 FL=1